MATLQFALAALSVMLRAWGHTEYLSAVEACLKNSDERNMRDKNIGPFKVWPTFIDREPTRRRLSHFPRRAAEKLQRTFYTATNTQK